MIFPLTRAHLAALTAYVFSLLSILVDVRLAVALLLLFVILCILAYFLPGCGFYLPVVSRGKKEENEVAITFNDGPSPEVTPLLLDLLARHGVSATFFVTGANAGRHPGIVKEIISRGHAVGNHSYSHSPFLMLKGMAEIRSEIAATQKVLKGIGVVPLVFRPPLGITGPRLWRPLLELGMFCVNSSCRDSGRRNRRTAGLAERLLKKAAPGDIILVNDVIERQENSGSYLKEIAMLLDGLHGRGIRVIPLDRLIGRETMLCSETPNGSKPVELFYNDLAPTYDHEQFQTAVSMSKRKEYALFSARLPELFAGAGRVLEIGAGTGIFTIPIARRCREVIAVDISRNMLGLLEKKAAGEGVANIRTILADVEMGPPEGTFSVICAFAAFEYMADLPGLLRVLSRHLDPGGAIFFITARCSFLRFFIQLGNAMRQGVWLKAHSRSEIREMLQAAGFEQIEINSHLFRVFNYGGMLLEVVARRSAGPNASVAPDEGGKECRI